jgi:hypothetical protein
LWKLQAPQYHPGLLPEDAETGVAVGGAAADVVADGVCPAPVAAAVGFFFLPAAEADTTPAAREEEEEEEEDTGAAEEETVGFEEEDTAESAGQTGVASTAAGAGAAAIGPLLAFGCTAPEEAVEVGG